jgi:hypothetical protein
MGRIGMGGIALGGIVARPITLLFTLIRTFLGTSRVHRKVYPTIRPFVFDTWCVINLLSYLFTAWYDVQGVLSLARPNDLTCQVCEKICSDDEQFFRHIHKNHHDYWGVFAGGRPLSDYIEPRRHAISRDKQKRFFCPVCDRAFAQVKAL